MATTVYHDWPVQATLALRLARCRQHLAEIEALLNGANVSADGKSIDRTTLEEKAKRLMDAIATMEVQAGDVGAPVVVAGVFRESTR